MIDPKSPVLADLTLNDQPIPAIVEQHASECANLRGVRSRLVRAPDVRLRDLVRHDARISSHLDGLALAGKCGASLCSQGLERPGAGEVFAVAVGALEAKDSLRLGELFALGEVLPSAHRGLLSAFGWASAAYLRGTVQDLLNSTNSTRRAVGVAACSLHRVDPGIASVVRVEDSDPIIRARVLRAAGELGLSSLVSICAAAIRDDDPVCQFWAAWSAVLLGDRTVALEKLIDLALLPGQYQRTAFHLVLQAAALPRAHRLLQWIAEDPGRLRLLIHGAGVAGDPAYVPWLIVQMDAGNVAPLAGEAFSFITGEDLSASKLRRGKPEEAESGPNDDPNDPNVEMDEDDGLPWPDSAKIRVWWNANSHRFQPGERYFMGQPLNRDHCMKVLQEGFQRQRIAAAHYLSLLNPGTPLFEWRAPAWRQRRLLTEMI
ncbi:MAG TPA: TIGR02270 family protein [Steroidobacteraceae bacterium]